MPKKTRKDKIIAAYRKRLQMLQSQQISTQTYATEKHIQTPPRKELPFIRERKIEELPVVKPQMTPSGEDVNITHYFKQDLRRSLILIVFVIGLEISLYFVSISTNLKLGH